MIYNEKVTIKITKLTSDESYQAMFMLHRYLMCAYAICHFVLIKEEDKKIKYFVKPYYNNLKVASSYLQVKLEDGFSDNEKQRKAIAVVFDETWAYVSKEMLNYFKSNYCTRKGIIEHLKIADHYAFEILKLMVKHEYNEEPKNWTNLKN